MVASECRLTALGRQTDLRHPKYSIPAVSGFVPQWKIPTDAGLQKRWQYLQSTARVYLLDGVKGIKRGNNSWKYFDSEFLVSRLLRASLGSRS